MIRDISPCLRNIWLQRLVCVDVGDALSVSVKIVPDVGDVEEAAEDDELTEENRNVNESRHDSDNKLALLFYFVLQRFFFFTQIN